VINMAIESVCGNFANIFFNNILILCAVSSIATAGLIALSYMIGQIFSNPKISLWSKTEIIQLFFSLVSIFFIIIFVQSFCSLNIGAVSELTTIPSTETISIFDAAEKYFLKSGAYIHTALNIEQYQLMSYNMLLLRGRYDCSFGPLLCLFGNSMISYSPYAWASVSMGILNISFNSTLIAFMSNLSFFFVLKYAASGFVMLFLPLGIFFRSLPYLRSLGSLFIAVAFSFMIVYPLILSVFYLILDDVIDIAKIDDVLESKYGDPQWVIDKSDASSVVYASFDLGTDDYIDNFLEADSSTRSRLETEIFKIAGGSFIFGVFIPTLALLGAVVSVSYIGKLLGEEIDLSRIMRMV